MISSLWLLNIPEGADSSLCPIQSPALAIAVFLAGSPQIPESPHTYLSFKGIHTADVAFPLNTFYPFQKLKWFEPQNLIHLLPIHIAVLDLALAVFGTKQPHDKEFWCWKSRRFEPHREVLSKAWHKSNDSTSSSTLCILRTLYISHATPAFFNG